MITIYDNSQNDANYLSRVLCTLLLEEIQSRAFRIWHKRHDIALGRIIRFASIMGGGVVRK